MLAGATTPGQSGPGSDGNEIYLHFHQTSNITWTSPSDCLVSYLGHSLGVTYPSVEKQSVYSTSPADTAKLYEGYMNVLHEKRSDAFIFCVWVQPLS